MPPPPRRSGRPPGCRSPCRRTNPVRSGCRSDPRARVRRGCRTGGGRSSDARRSPRCRTRRAAASPGSGRGPSAAARRRFPRPPPWTARSSGWRGSPPGRRPPGRRRSARWRAVRSGSGGSDGGAAVVEVLVGEELLTQVVLRLGRDQARSPEQVGNEQDDQDPGHEEDAPDAHADGRERHATMLAASTPSTSARHRRPGTLRYDRPGPTVAPAGPAPRRARGAP